MSEWILTMTARAWAINTRKKKERRCSLPMVSAGYLRLTFLCLCWEVGEWGSGN
jgi:hypothetical protein